MSQTGAAASSRCGIGRRGDGVAAGGSWLGDVVAVVVAVIGAAALSMWDCRRRVRL